MFRKLKTYIKKPYYAIISSIAFYPTLISILFLLLAFTMLYLESMGLTEFVKENIAFLVISDASTARAILSTLISGIISLKVFSFSMVMVLLNQASNNYSPRLLPGLISDKRNQFVLGIFLGSLIYNIIVLISIIPVEGQHLNGFSVLIGIVWGIFCLGMFVFFIHTISTGIQISSILEKTYKNARNNLEKLIEKNEPGIPSVIDDLEITIKSDKGGFFQELDLNQILQIAEKNQTNIQVKLYRGLYVKQEEPMVLLDQEIEENEKTHLKSIFLFSNNFEVFDNYLLGIRHITEVGIKAMSPGINDPGTAINTLNYLTELFSLRLQLPDYSFHYTENKRFVVVIPQLPFETLFHDTFAAFRTYCKHDYNLAKKMIETLTTLERRPMVSDGFRQTIRKQIHTLEMDIQREITNSNDLEILMNLIKG